MNNVRGPGFSDVVIKPVEGDCDHFLSSRERRLGSLWLPGIKVTRMVSIFVLLLAWKISELPVLDQHESCHRI